MNDALIFLRQVRLARQLLDVVAVRLSARYSPGGSMRLLEKACVGQVGHVIADGRGTQSLTIATLQGARSYQLARGYAGLHDRAKIKMKTQTHIAVIGAGAFGGWTA